MRQNNKYLEKVRDELTVYQKFILDSNTELTPAQKETWDKIDTVRAWLREGYSDSQAISMLKSSRSVQERRAREILTMAYSVFAELRASKDKEGTKYLYAEMFREAAKKALDESDYYNYSLLLKEAAKIEGAYESEKIINTEQYKKAAKVVFKIRQVNVNGSASATNQPPQIEDVSHEVIR